MYNFIEAIAQQRKQVPGKNYLGAARINDRAKQALYIELARFQAKPDNTTYVSVQSAAQ